MKIIRKIGDKLFYRRGIFNPTKALPLKWTKDLTFALEENKKIINVGAGQNKRSGIINIDPAYEKEDQWSIKARGEDLPFRDNSIDFSICNAVLEHVKEPKKIVDEIYRVLKPEGKVYFDIPFIFPFHAAPNDYNRMTLQGLEYLCRKFKKIESGMCLGPNSGIAQILVDYNQIFFKNKLLKKIVKNITKIAVSPLKYFDKLLVNKKEAVRLAAGVYFYGKK